MKHQSITRCPAVSTVCRGLVAAIGCAVLALTAMVSSAAPALVPGSDQNFEGGGLGYTLGGGFGAGGTSDYWEVIPNDGTRVDPVIITTGGVFGNASPVGGSVLAGDDVNADIGSSKPPVSVTFNAVNVSGLANLSVEVLLAASNPTQGASNRGFESTDSVEIQVSYDGGAYQQLAIYEQDPSFNSGLNSFLSEDTNLDGLGDAGSGNGVTAIEQGFKNFSHALNTATTVQIRIVCRNESTGEYVAIDDFRIFGEVAATVSPAIGGVPGAALNYTESDPATDIAPALTVTDSDSTDLTGATVQITSNNTPTEDVLAATPVGGIAVAYDSVTGTLTLSGSTTLANYQATLRSVTYQNTEILNPNTSQRTVTFLVTDDQSNNSNPATRAINVANNIQTHSIPYTESFDDGLGTGDRYDVVGGFDAGQNDFFGRLPSGDAGVRFAIPSIF